MTNFGNFLKYLRRNNDIFKLKVYIYVCHFSRKLVRIVIKIINDIILRAFIRDLTSSIRI